MLQLLLPLLLALPPGRYQGESARGAIDLELRADGTATFGGARLRWTAGRGALDLVGDGVQYSFDVETHPLGATLSGGPFGTLYVWREAVDPPREPPAAPPQQVNPILVGHWRHQATGGAVTFELNGDGSYRLVQAQVGATAQAATGRWWSEPGALVLAPSAGVTLRYTVERVDGALEIGGGDLPFPVRFRQLAQVDGPPLYSPRRDPRRQ